VVSLYAQLWIIHCFLYQLISSVQAQTYNPVNWGNLLKNPVWWGRHVGGRVRVVCKFRRRRFIHGAEKPVSREQNFDVTWCCQVNILCFGECDTLLTWLFLSSWFWFCQILCIYKNFWFFTVILFAVSFNC